MSGIISGNMVGGGAPLKTLILTDKSGNEVIGVVTGSEVIFTATDNDVREGMVYASDSGVSTGSKFIPPYYTTKGYKVIPAGSEFKLVLSDRDAYDYTSFQCLICSFNTSIEDSVSTEKVVIEDNVYLVNSTSIISEVSKDVNSKSVILGITNDGNAPCIMRYFTYKEDT